MLLTGGVHYQEIKAENFAYADGSRETLYDENRLTPVAGIVVKLAEGLSLYGKYI